MSAESARAAGRLYLIPTPLGAQSDPRAVLPAETLAVVRRLDCFVVENARSARAFLKSAGTDLPLQALEIHELNEHTQAAAIPGLLAPLHAGRDLGLLSEAGCPAIADPGADLVAAAHALGLRVVPLIGPSAPLLALMASGLNGQRFAFVGYLPAQAEPRAARLRELERRSGIGDETVLWIETPYRNQQVFETALAVLAPSTRLLVAAQLSLPAESVQTRTVHEWQKTGVQLEKAPTVFGLLGQRANPGAAPHNPHERARGAVAGRNASTKGRDGADGRPEKAGPRAMQGARESKRKTRREG
jgi:16S rRNA (cytidine1402-2'-O)-methyltransferase